MKHITNNSVCLKQTVKSLKEYDNFEYYKLSVNDQIDYNRLKNDLKSNLPYDLPNYYLPSLDYSNRIDLMRYCNNNISYGVSFDLVSMPDVNNIKFHICRSPILSTVIYEILETFDTYQEMKDSFYKYKNILST